MKKRAVEVTEVANIINEKLRKGAFLTSKSGDKVNSMVIGWGHIGRVWERPVFIAYVRTSRYTSELIDSNPEFTVNVPVNGFTKEAFDYCQTPNNQSIAL
jgi:flavin reductase (DIM6/NTAB) family NADH-FMN oxidoreductase RutF